MKYIVINFKSNLLKNDIIKYNEYFNKINITKELIVLPSAPYYYLLTSPNIKLGSQDISRYKAGPCTGEVNGEQLKDNNVSYVFIGHPERRRNHNEENQELLRKINHTIDNDMKTIIGIGEKKETNTKKTIKLVTKEIFKLLDEIPKSNLDKILLAYEPLWAVSKNINIDYKKIEDIIQSIKELIFKKYQINIPILYGGSVNEFNINNLNNINQLDGVVLASVSLDMERLNKVLTFLSKSDIV